MAAYDRFYLNGNRKITEYLFHLILESPYDFYESIKEYMAHSEIRRKMDEGNWSALNKGIKQVYNSIDFSEIPLGDNGYMDETVSDWIADVYVYLQWEYMISSAEIVSWLPPETVCQNYNPLHETSLSNACVKLYQKYRRTL